MTDEQAREVAAFADVIAGVANVIESWARAWDGLRRTVAPMYRTVRNGLRAIERDHPQAVPPWNASPWRKRYERRVFGRTLTPGERIAHNIRAGTWPDADSEPPA